MTRLSPPRYFKISPEIIRLGVMLYVGTVSGKADG
jgi:hypothetical protein